MGEVKEEGRAMAIKSNGCDMMRVCMWRHFRIMTRLLWNSFLTVSGIVKIVDILMVVMLIIYTDIAKTNRGHGCNIGR